MFRTVSSRPNLTLLEEQTLNFWKLRRTFAKSSQQRQGQAEFALYERPPGANRRPDMQHALGCAFQDALLRYRQMRGYHVVRRGGWDTHGLQVELGVERQLGLSHRSQIEAYGVERFNEACRKSAFEFIQEWERFSDRIGFWADMQDAYVTYTSEYIESLWWILKTFWDRGLLYQATRATPYCPRCGTPLSDYEATLNVRETTGPAAIVRLPLADEVGASLLAWTSAPWTLPGNAAVAAHPEAEYVVIVRALPEGGSERLILARPLVEQVFGEEHVRVVDTFKGKKLKGRRYKPLFTFLVPDRPAHFVILRETVSMESGTGFAPLAPAFGEKDLQAALEFDLPVLTSVAEDGTFVPEVRPWSGKFFQDADPLIIQDLEQRGLLFRTEMITHPGPHCNYCDTRLLEYTRSAWYLRTGQFKERLATLERQIHWLPAHTRQKRAAGWPEGSADWRLGRERYWGAPLPVWVCGRCRHQVAAGSLADLSRLAGRDLSGLDLHRPHVDRVTFPCPECGSREGGMMQRVPEVVDVWFDSGAMPVAQWHFPFEAREDFRAHFPADLVCEPVERAHGWFDSLHTISALLFDIVAFKNAITLEPAPELTSQSTAGAGNLWQVLNAHGADALRWHLYTASPPAGEIDSAARILERVGAGLTDFTWPVWEVYAFFVAQANLARWQPVPPEPDAHHTPLPVPRTVEEKDGEGEYRLLDRWLRSELHGLVQTITEALDGNDAPTAARLLRAFVQDLSGWYLPRSRRRFWQTADEAGKQAVFATLHGTLLTLSKLLAPILPFLAEALYQNLARSFDPGALESVHQSDWPGYDPAQTDPLLGESMRAAIQLAEAGLAARRQAGVKPSQPLAQADFAVTRPDERQAVARYAGLLADALNVMQVRLLELSGEPGSPDPAIPVVLHTELTTELRRAGLAGEFIQRIQALRQQAGLETGDRIRIYLNATPGLVEALDAHRETVLGETQAVELEYSEPPGQASGSADAWFDGQWMKVAILMDLNQPDDSA